MAVFKSMGYSTLDARLKGYPCGKWSWIRTKDTEVGRSLALEAVKRCHADGGQALWVTTRERPVGVAPDQYLLAESLAAVLELDAAVFSSQDLVVWEEPDAWLEGAPSLSGNWEELLEYVASHLDTAHVAVGYREGACVSKALRYYSYLTLQPVVAGDVWSLKVLKTGYTALMNHTLDVLHGG
jgi:hypothetical protein